MDFTLLSSTMLPLYLQTHWRLRTPEKINEEKNKEIESLRKSLASFPRNVALNTETREGLDYVKLLFEDRQINPAYFLTMLDALSHSNSERRRRTLHNVQDLFSSYYAKESLPKIDEKNITPRKAFHAS